MKRLPSIQNSQTEETKIRILNQAKRLFLEKGYHAASIDDISQAVGLTKGALYCHFKNKEDLLRKILEEFEKDFLEGLIHSVEEVKGGALEKFEKLFRYSSAFGYYHREVCVTFSSLSAELVGTHSKIEGEIRRIYSKYQKFLSTLILQGKKEKIFRKEVDVNLAALTIIAFHDGILLKWFMNQNKIDGEAFVKESQRIIVNGLKVRPVEEKAKETEQA